MVAGKCNSQEKFSDRRIRNLRQKMQLRRHCTTTGKTVTLSILILGAESVLGRRKIPGRTLSFC